MASAGLSTFPSFYAQNPMKAQKPDAGSSSSSVTGPVRKTVPGNPNFCIGEHNAANLNVKLWPKRGRVGRELVPAMREMIDEHLEEIKPKDVVLLRDYVMRKLHQSEVMRHKANRRMGFLTGLKRFLPPIITVILTLGLSNDTARMIVYYTALGLSTIVTIADSFLSSGSERGVHTNMLYTQLYTQTMAFLAGKGAYRAYAKNRAAGVPRFISQFRLIWDWYERIMLASSQKKDDKDKDKDKDKDDDKNDGNSGPSALQMYGIGGDGGGAAFSLPDSLMSDVQGTRQGFITPEQRRLPSVTEEPEQGLAPDAREGKGSEQGQGDGEKEREKEKEQEREKDSKQGARHFFSSLAKVPLGDRGLSLGSGSGAKAIEKVTGAMPDAASLAMATTAADAIVSGLDAFRGASDAEDASEAVPKKDMSDTDASHDWPTPALTATRTPVAKGAGKKGKDTKASSRAIRKAAASASHSDAR